MVVREPVGLRRLGGQVNVERRSSGAEANADAVDDSGSAGLAETEGLQTHVPNLAQAVIAVRKPECRAEPPLRCI